MENPRQLANTIFPVVSPQPPFLAEFKELSRRGWQEGWLSSGLQTMKISSKVSIAADEWKVKKKKKKIHLSVFKLISMAKNSKMLLRGRRPSSGARTGAAGVGQACLPSDTYAAPVNPASWLSSAPMGPSSPTSQLGPTTHSSHDSC